MVPMLFLKLSSSIRWQACQLIKGLNVFHGLYIIINSQFSNSNLVLYQDQKGFPGELFPVKMYALTTDMPKRVLGARSKMQANRPAVIK